MKKQHTRVGAIVFVLILLVISCFIYTRAVVQKWVSSHVFSSIGNSSVMRLYVNKEVGISLQYPAAITAIKEEYPSNGWYILLTNSKNVIERDIPNINVPDSAEIATISVQITITNGTKYEIPQSGGKIVAITEDNLSLFHLVTGEEMEKGYVRSRPTLKSHMTILNKEGHLTYSILDTNRLIKINVDTNDLQKYPYETLDEIVSSFQFL